MDEMRDRVSKLKPWWIRNMVGNGCLLTGEKWIFPLEQKFQVLRQIQFRRYKKSQAPQKQVRNRSEEFCSESILKASCNPLVEKKTKKNVYDQLCIQIFGDRFHFTPSEVELSNRLALTVCNLRVKTGLVI